MKVYQGTHLHLARVAADCAQGTGSARLPQWGLGDVARRRGEYGPAVACWSKLARVSNGARQIVVHAHDSARQANLGQGIINVSFRAAAAK